MADLVQCFENFDVPAGLNGTPIPGSLPSGWDYLNNGGPDDVYDDSIGIGLYYDTPGAPLPTVVPPGCARHDGDTGFLPARYEPHALTTSPVPTAAWGASVGGRFASSDDYQGGQSVEIRVTVRPADIYSGGWQVFALIETSDATSVYAQTTIYDLVTGETLATQTQTDLAYNGWYLLSMQGGALFDGTITAGVIPFAGAPSPDGTTPPAPAGTEAAVTAAVTHSYVSDCKITHSGHGTRWIDALAFNYIPPDAGPPRSVDSLVRRYPVDQPARRTPARRGGRRYPGPH